MGATKKDGFSDQQNQIAALAKALGHPARVAILEHLLAADKCICGDIVQELPLAQPTVSQHLKELKNANLIQGEVEGTAICYCINPETLQSLTVYFTTILQKVNLKNCC